jgi:hydrogenase maturation protease
MTLLIGYGNPLRGDDALGWLVAQHLLASGPPPHLDVIAAHELTPELAEPISQATRVLFVDARADSQPGLLTWRIVLPAAQASPALTHQLGPGALLALARLLYGRCPQAWLYTVGGASFEYGEQLSPPVALALARLLSRWHPQSGSSF